MLKHLRWHYSLFLPPNIPVPLQTVATTVMDQTLERGAHKEMYAGKSVRRTDGRTDGRRAETHYRKKLEQTLSPSVRPSVRQCCLFLPGGNYSAKELSHIPP